MRFANDNKSTVSRLMRRLSNSQADKDNSTSERTPKLGAVSIPSPGVPENMAVNLDVEVFSLVIDDSEEEGGCR